MAGETLTVPPAAVERTERPEGQGGRARAIAVRGLGRLIRILERLTAGVEALERRIADVGTVPGWRAAHRQSVTETMSAYDMLARPDEAYYAREYLDWILPALEERLVDRACRLLDLGCAQGRLALPLAAWCAPRGGHVVGVDVTPAAIDRARAEADRRALRNVTFECADLVPYVREVPDATFDAVLFVEVAFILPEYRLVVQEAARLLRPGGVLVAAFRSQYYNLLHAVRKRAWRAAEMVLAAREGRVFGGTTWFSWQTADDARALVASVGLTVEAVRGVGACSGIEGDPLAAIARPEMLTPSEQARLMEIERTAAERHADAGRYILVVATKPAGPTGSRPKGGSER